MQCRKVKSFYDSLFFEFNFFISPIKIVVEYQPVYSVVYRKAHHYLFFLVIFRFQFTTHEKNKFNCSVADIISKHNFYFLQKRRY